MTITRERQLHCAKRQTGEGGDSCAVKDPTRGDGIFIENMPEAAE